MNLIKVKAAVNFHLRLQIIKLLRKHVPFLEVNISLPSYQHPDNSSLPVPTSVPHDNGDERLVSRLLGVLHLHPAVVGTGIVVTDTTHEDFAVLDASHDFVEVKFLVVGVPDVAEDFVA